MLNRAVIVGRLTKDVDLRYTQNGTAVANFTVAANRPFKNDQGEQEADFINCVIWRKPAESLATYMKKGSLIGVEGRIQTRSFDDKEGKRVFVTEVLAESVQFLESRNSQNNANTGGYGQSNTNYQNNQQNTSYTPKTNANEQDNAFANDGQEIDIDDSDLPF